MLSIATRNTTQTGLIINGAPVGKNAGHIALRIIAELVTVD